MAPHFDVLHAAPSGRHVGVWLRFEAHCWFINVLRNLSHARGAIGMWATLAEDRWEGVEREGE